MAMDAAVAGTVGTETVGPEKCRSLGVKVARAAVPVEAGAAATVGMDKTFVVC